MVDIRADIYALGGTLYFMLTGQTPFPDGTIAAKLVAHQTREPQPVESFRPDVPAGLLAVLRKMMAKDPADRYQEPIEVAEALAEWADLPITPPPEREMPMHCPLVQALAGPRRTGLGSRRWLASSSDQAAACSRAGLGGASERRFRIERGDGKFTEHRAFRDRFQSQLSARPDRCRAGLDRPRGRVADNAHDQARPIGLRCRGAAHPHWFVASGGHRRTVGRLFTSSSPFCWPSLRRRRGCRVSMSVGPMRERPPRGRRDSSAPRRPGLIARESPSGHRMMNREIVPAAASVVAYTCDG